MSTHQHHVVLEVPPVARYPPVAGEAGRLPRLDVPHRDAHQVPAIRGAFFADRINKKSCFENLKVDFVLDFRTEMSIKKKRTISQTNL